MINSAAHLAQPREDARKRIKLGIHSLYYFSFIITPLFIEDIAYLTYEEKDRSDMHYDIDAVSRTVHLPSTTTSRKDIR